VSCRAGAADQDQVALLSDERAAGEIAHQVLVDSPRMSKTLCLRTRQLEGRRGRAVDATHLEGIAGACGRPARAERADDDGSSASPPALLRPLAEHGAVAGGGF
jgi:hypothetical protein